jgi:hypothetical protein
VLPVLGPPRSSGFVTDVIGYGHSSSTGNPAGNPYA